MYLSPKIRKRLNNISARPVISNWGTLTVKISDFLDHHLQTIMKAGKSYINGAGNFLKKLKNIDNIPSNSILVNAEVVGIHPSIPHNAGLQDLYKKLEERTDKKIPSTDLVKMTEFILKNNLFEFETKIIQQISGTAIGAKFVPWYGCFFLDQIE